jgi:signal transduction histidine kinase
VTDTQRIRELVSINREIASIADPSEALRTLVDKAAALTNADACVLVGSSPTGPSRGAIVACSVGLDSNLARSFSAPLDEDLGPSVRDQLKLGGEAMFFAVPLISGRQINGLLAVSHRPPATPPPDQELLMSALADRALICLELAQSRRSAEQQRFLDTVSAGLAESVDTPNMLERVVELLLPRLGDWCIVDLVEEDQRIEQLLAAHIDPDKAPILRELVRHPSAQLGLENGAENGLAHVILSGEAEIHPDVSDLLSVAAALGIQSMRMLWSLGVSSYVCVPLKARGRVVGAITLVYSDSGRRHGPTDLALAEEFSMRTALALDNARLYRKAQERLRLRDEFVVVASHELRTPLTVLRLQLQSLERAIGNIEIIGPLFEGLARGIKKAIGHCDQVVQIGDRLLDVSHMSSGRFKPDLQDTDLSDVVRDVADRFVDQMAHARCPLRLTIQPDVHGRWDRLRLEEVVTNLLSNAVKYAPGGPVEVELFSDSNTATLHIRDHGSGIGKEDEERIFERFERAIATQRAMGWGLGLYVCRQIIEAHGGTIQVASEPGAGATFVVQLPLSPPRTVSSEART